MSEQVIDGVGEPGTEIVAAPISTSPAQTPVRAADLVQRLATIREAMDQAMEREVDYGPVPGTNKPTLFKPGAEKLAVLFQLDVQTTHEERYGPGDHLTASAHSVVYHAPDGRRLGSGEGLCSTRERKYAYRQQERVCPKCGKPAIIKGKAEYGGGWVCWRKREGCGASFKDGEEAIESQPAGEIENPDLPDLWNTVIKMARKRAIVDAVLLVTGASALFTQDMDDQVETAQQEQQPPNGRSKPPMRDTREREQRVTAAAPQQSPPAASAKQRRLICAKAGEKNLPPADLANVLLVATGQKARAFESQEAAQESVNRWLDRLPAESVDGVLEGIERCEGVEA